MNPSETQRRFVLRGLVEATTGKINLSALGTGAVAAAAFQSWPLLVLGGAAYAALAAWDLTSKSFWRRLREAKPEAESLPRPGHVSDAEVRAAVERIQAARGAIDAALAEAPETVALQVKGSLLGLEELETRAARLVDLAESLARHLSHANVPRLEAEQRGLLAKATSTSDAESRKLYEQAASARGEELSALEDVWRARERLLANLARIISNLEGVPTRIVRMRVLDAQSVDGSSDEIGWEIGRINGELAALEQTLEVLAADSPT